jgi:rieske iron-sulfur protein
VNHVNSRRDRDGRDHPAGCGCPRRDFLKLAVLAAVGLSVSEARGDESEASWARPRAGDRLVAAEGQPRAGERLGPADLPLGGPQVLAWPVDPVTEVVRNGSRLNQVLLIRFDPRQLSEATRANAAEGVVAYSAVCTHEGCDVSQWKKDSNRLLCVCHGSEFDPLDKAAVVAGPAPRRLPMLPITIEGGALVVADAFVGRPGFKNT